MIRIIGGEFRSRVLKSPVGQEVTRPMAARVKESIFNILREYFDEGGSVLDLYAGVGTMGLEAVSRGAEHVLMVEQNRQTFRILQENIEALGVQDRAEAMLGDALSMVPLQRAAKPVDVVFVDPPYAQMQSEASRRKILSHIARCAEIMNRPSFVVLRSPVIAKDVDMSIEGFEGPELHDYGHDMQVRLYMPV